MPCYKCGSSDCVMQIVPVRVRKEFMYRIVCRNCGAHTDWCNDRTGTVEN